MRSRREFLLSIATIPAVAALAGCSAAPESATSSSTASIQAGQPQLSGVAAAPTTNAGAALTATPATVSPASEANAPGSPAGQAVTIRFESYNYGAPGLGGQGSQMIIDEFQAMYPNITIAPRNVPSDQGVQTVVAETAAGDPPEIAQIGLNNLEYIVHNLPVQAVDEFAPPDEYAEFTQHILPQALKLGMSNGHLYGSPYTFSTPTLFYNADTFTAAGLDPAKPPATWDEVRQYAQQIKNNTDKAPLHIAALGAFDWLIQSMINSNGGTTLSADKSTATFNQPPAIEVYTMWQQLVNDGLHPKLATPDAHNAMVAGNLAMYLQTTAELPAIRDGATGQWDLRTGAEPAFGDKRVHPVNSGSALFVFTNDQVRQQAAWKFLQFAGSQRGFTIITSVMGYLPQRNDVVDDPSYLKPFFDRDARLRPTLQQLATLEQWVSWPGQNAAQALQLFMTALQNVVYTGQAPQTTMDEAADRVNQLLKSG